MWAFLDGTALPVFYAQPSLVQTAALVVNTNTSLNFSSVESLNGTVNTTPSIVSTLEGVALYNLSFVESASLLLGVRLRQLRVSPRQCSNAIAASLLQYFAMCYPQYSHVDEDSSDHWLGYGPNATRDEFTYRLIFCIKCNSFIIVINCTCSTV